jgi:hypothetical protein
MEWIHVRSALRTGAALLGLLGAVPAAAETLSNVPVASNSSTYNRLAALFGINLAAFPAGDGYAFSFHFYTGARSGVAGTEAEGLYLYEYWFETGDGCLGDGLAVRQLSIPFGSVVPFDIDGDGGSATSFYTPYSSGCGAATVADTVSFDGSRLLLDYPSGVAGGIANVFVISDQPPQAVSGTLTAEGLGSTGFATWSAAPEPGAALGGAAAWAALAALRRRDRQP